MNPNIQLTFSGYTRMLMLQVYRNRLGWRRFLLFDYWKLKLDKRQN